VAPLQAYCTGLLLPCERKSVEPMAAVTAPTRVSAQHQSMLHFISQGGWSDDNVLGKVRGLVVDNLCLRQQLVVLQRRTPRPRLKDADRRFWVLASRWFGGWRTSVLIVKPETVLGWHRRGWRTYIGAGVQVAGRRWAGSQLHRNYGP